MSKVFDSYLGNTDIVFSKYYSLGGVGLNFFICGFCFLWVNIVKCFVTSIFEGEFEKTQINMESMVSNIDKSIWTYSYGESILKKF